jgi:hypothetical protein
MQKVESSELSAGASCRRSSQVNCLLQTFLADPKIRSHGFKIRVSKTCVVLSECGTPSHHASQPDPREEKEAVNAPMASH